MEEVLSCKFCGSEITANVQKCKHCGEWLEEKPQQAVNVVINNQNNSANNGFVSPKSKWVAFILLFLGLHRFYVGKFFSGILFLATAGGAGLWALVDAISILSGNFKDNCNLPLR